MSEVPSPTAQAIKNHHHLCFLAVSVAKQDERIDEACKKFACGPITRRFRAAVRQRVGCTCMKDEYNDDE